MIGQTDGKISLAVILLFLAVISPVQPAAAQTRVTVGVTETMETFHPYGDSVALLNTIWCQVNGCLVGYDFDKGDYVGLLAERWEVKNPNTWIFYLRKNSALPRRHADDRGRRRALL